MMEKCIKAVLQQVTTTFGVHIVSTIKEKCTPGTGITANMRTIEDRLILIFKGIKLHTIIFPILYLNVN